ncbi:C4-dicarboxylate ABC transporter [Shouchella clausii]|uniref:TRAP transporter small permease n=1 Tax=Shouchella clausii TaxID=79880 RepID=UPI000BA5FF45|nr:TRAP transporter small permease [Shouchella clausii]PAD47744.1 C4-dicarboxylate ABC transporter permease [Shouchella clausii]GIN15491.1 C4-dicarboxylate ABC transporter [Shouchella clausii]
MLLTVKNVKTFLNRLIMTVASMLTVVLVCCALWQILSRYVLGSPSIITEELSRFLLIWAAMLGAAYAFGSKEQLAIVFLKSKLSGLKKKLVEIFIDVTIIMFAGSVLIKGGYNLASQTLSQTSPILGIPMGYVYAILPVTGVLIIIYQLLSLAERRGQNESSEQ